MALNDIFFIVLIGASLDTLVGDPYWMPHPIRTFGNAITLFERKLNRGNFRIAKGAISWIILCCGAWSFFHFAGRAIVNFSDIPYIAYSAIFFFYAISNRCLIEEGLKVERILAKGDLAGARKQLSMIVGRDTSELSANQIRSAVVETLSENLSDGVVAPLLYFAIGGIPMMMLYKMINTLDSMVGYKNERYKDFGFVSAKMDDVANFIPARLTAFLMVVASFSWRAITHIAKYSSNHSSPNSGYPESALSGVLDCRLGGPSSYFGTVVEKPYIGENSRELTHEDVIATLWLNGKVAAICYAALLIFSFYQRS
ncbi:MAG: adenosylcobinamide-phosphate synthase CbiB [Rikenellaceae bacterium]